MKNISEEMIKTTVARLCIQANMKLPTDIVETIALANSKEKWPLAKDVLNIIQENIVVAEASDLPMCQDTGAACVFVEIGQDIHIEGNFERAIQDGVKEGYLKGYLRKSMVADPLQRKNTDDNTPAFITTHIISGDKMKITVMPKGFGSENMSKMAMLKPADGITGVEQFVLETVRVAGPNPCPPIIVGIGIGGTFDYVTYLAKKALLRPLNIHNNNPFYANFEKELLKKINELGIGPQGFGGQTTALAVAVEYAGTHVAGLPVAVNIGCHVTRRASAEV